MRVIDRVHGHATNGGSDTSPTCSAGFTKLAKIVFSVTNFAEGCTTFHMNATNFTGAKAKLSIAALTSEKLGTAARGPGKLSPFSGKHLDAVNGRTHWNIANGQSVAWPDGRLWATHKGGSDLETFRGNDVTTLAVCIAEKSNVRAPVGVVLNTLNLGWNSIFKTAEVDNPVMLLMPTPTVTGSNATKVISASGSRLGLNEASKGLSLVKVGVYNPDHGALASRGGLHFNDGHD